MKTHNLQLAIAVTVGLIPGTAVARHKQHQPGAQAASAELMQCARVQSSVDNIVSGAMARLEAARQSNTPSEMRAAVDHFEAALRDIRAQLEPCKAAASASDPHAGHTMPGSQQAPGATAPESHKPAADPHAGHAMPGPALAPRTSPMPKPTPTPSKERSEPKADPHAGHAMPKPETKPEPAKRESPKASDPHAGHGATKPSPEGMVMDPVNGLMVNPAKAPKTTYQGQTYYFSSEESRKEFLQNPAKFVKKPKQ